MNTFRDHNREARRKEYQKPSPFVSLGALALLSGLTRDTIFFLVEKGVFTPTYNEAGKMLIKRSEILRWLRENDSKWPTRAGGD
jgi:predicted DNA-binding transcriptional regulator AlpA